MRAPNLSCTQLGFMFRGFSTPGSGTQAMCLCIPLLEVGFAQHAFDMTRRTVHLCIARRASRKDRPRAMTRMLGVRCLVPLPRPARLPIGATRGRRAASHTGRAPAAARTSSPATRTCPHPQQAAAEEDHSAGAWVRRGERPAVRCCAAAVRSQGAPSGRGASPFAGEEDADACGPHHLARAAHEHEHHHDVGRGRDVRLGGEREGAGEACWLNAETPQLWGGRRRAPAATASFHDALGCVGAA